MPTTTKIIDMKLEAKTRLQAAAEDSLELQTKFVKDLRVNSKFFATWKQEHAWLTLKFNGEKYSVHKCIEDSAKALATLGWKPTPAPSASSHSPFHVQSYEQWFVRRDGTFLMCIYASWDTRGVTAYAYCRLVRSSKA